jgi:hypothetical protein
MNPTIIIIVYQLLAGGVPNVLNTLPWDKSYDDCRIGVQAINDALKQADQPGEPPRRAACEIVPSGRSEADAIAAFVRRPLQ